MPDRITTREAAIEEMLRWANGEKSHWNEYCGLMGRASDALPAVVAAVTTESLAADTAEVQKWAAVAGALPERGGKVCGNAWSPTMRCTLPAGHEGDHQNFDESGRKTGWLNNRMAP